MVDLWRAASTRQRYLVLIALTFAAAVRIALIVTAGWDGASLDYDGHEGRGQLLAAFRYRGLGRLFGEGIYHPPGYSMLIGLVYSVTGGSRPALFGVQLLLDLGTAVLLGAVAARWFGSRSGAIAVALYSFALVPALYVTELFKEPFAAFLAALTIWLSGEVLRQDVARRRRTVTGALLGSSAFAAVLTNPFLGVALLPMLVALLVRAWTDLEVRRALVAGTVAVAVPAALFAARNHALTDGRVAFVSTNFGVNLFLGHWGTSDEKNALRAATDLDPLEESQVFTELALNNIRQHSTGELISHELTKLRLALTTIENHWVAAKAEIVGPGYQRFADLAAQQTRWWILVMTVAAFVISPLRWWRGPWHGPALAVFLGGLSFLLLPVLFVWWHRFLLPAYPFLIVSAAATAGALPPTRSRGPTRPGGPRGDPRPPRSRSPLGPPCRPDDDLTHDQPD